MEDTHRRLIKSHKQRLVEISSYDEMKDHLLNKGVFTPVMFSIIEQDTDDELKRLDKLYEKLTHRGPEAFGKLVEVFRDANIDEGYKLLSPSVVAPHSIGFPAVMENRYLSIRETVNLNRQTINVPQVSPNELARSNIINNNLSDPEDSKSTDGIASSKSQKSLKLEPYTKETVSTVEVKKAEHFGSHRLLPVYPMKSKRRGVFFFLNIINFQNEKGVRKGAHRDRENLVSLFKELGFTVFYYEDLKRHEFLDLLDQLINSTYLKNIDSFFLCVQTHGDLQNNQTIMEFSDGLVEKIDTIISMFSNNNCQSLIDKPKVFFFPFCRGKISDRHKFVPVIETDGKPPSQARLQLRPSFSDILICYATIPGFLSHRNSEYGSWYVIEICKAFAQHAHECHLEELLKLVGTNTMNIEESIGRTQVASFESRGFNKLLFLNPGISDP